MANGFDALHVDSNDLLNGQDLLDAATRLHAASCEAGVALDALSLDAFERVGLEDVAAARAIVDEGLNVADALGVGMVYLPSFGAARIRTDRDLHKTAALIRYTIEQSEQRDLVIASENGLDTDGVRRLFDLVDDPRARLLFDTQNPVFGGYDAADLLAGVLDLLAPYIHVKDGKAELGDAVLGEGDAELVATLQLLARSGFAGRPAVESDYRNDDGTRAALDLQMLTRALLAREQES